MNIDSYNLNNEYNSLAADIIRRAGARTIGDGQVIALPRDMELHRIEAVIKLHPTRNVKQARLYTLAALVDFVQSERHLSGEPVTWFVGNENVRAILNYQRKGLAGWADSYADFKTEHTIEWQAWKSMNRRPMTQEEFCDFLEDHRDDIAEPAGADVLQLVANFRQQRQVSYESAYSTTDGDIKLRYEEDSTGTKREARIPAEITLELPVLDGAEEQTTYRIKARLRTRIKERALTFTYQLIRPDIPEKNARADIAEHLREVAGKGDTVHIGWLTGTPDEILQSAFEH